MKMLSQRAGPNGQGCCVCGGVFLPTGGYTEGKGGVNVGADTPTITNEVSDDGEVED